MENIILRHDVLSEGENGNLIRLPKGSLGKVLNSLEVDPILEKIPKEKGKKFLDDLDKRMKYDRCNIVLVSGYLCILKLSDFETLHDVHKIYEIEKEA